MVRYLSVLLVLALCGSSAYAATLVTHTDYGTTVTSTTSTVTWTTQTTIPGADLEANTKYLFYASLGLGSDGAQCDYQITGDGGVLYSGSKDPTGSSGDTAQVVWSQMYTTDASPDDIDFDYKVSSGTTCYGVHGQIILLDLSNLTENTHYFQDLDTADLTSIGTSKTTADNRSTITLTSADGVKDWFALCSLNYEVDTTANSFFYDLRATGNGETMEAALEGETTSEIILTTLMRVFEDLSSNANITIGLYGEGTSGGYDVIDSSCFAIDLDSFEDSAHIHNTTDVTFGVNDLQNITVVTYTPTNDSATLIFSQYFQGGSASGQWYDQMLIDGVTSPTGWDWQQGALEYKSGHDTTDQVSSHISTNKTIADTGEVFAIEIGTGGITAPTMFESSITFLSTAVSGGGGAPPTDTCECPGTGINHEFDLSDFCVVTACLAANVTYTGTGNITCAGSWNITSMGGLPANQRGYCTGACVGLFI